MSVVIPNYNGMDLLERYLPSVLAELAATNIPGELVIADDASTDDSLLWLASSPLGRDTRIVKNEHNLGFPRTANAGISAARSDVVLLLNSDVEVGKGSLLPLLERFRGEDDLFAAVPFLSNTLNDGRDQALCEGHLHRGWISVHYPWPERQLAGEAIRPVLYPCGGAMLVHRRKFLDLGGFAPCFTPGYFEDVDLGYRAWKQGWRSEWVPRSIMLHHDGRTMKRRFSSWKRSLLIERNKWLFMWRNLTDSGPWAAHVLHLPFRLMRSLLCAPLRVLGFLRALPYLPEIVETRRQSRRSAIVGDLDLLSRWAPSYGPGDESGR